MTAEALVSQCHSLGVLLAVSPEGKLRATPPGRLPGALKETLKQRKAEVLALLTSTPSWPCPQCGGAVRLDPVDVSILPTRFWTCPACDAYGATREGARCPVVWVNKKTVQ